MGDDEIWCSMVMDPFPRMVEWLESICRGERWAIWEIDEEGLSALLIYHADLSISDGAGARLILCEASDEVWHTCAMAVSPRAVVAAIWSAFRAMVADSAYTPREWEMPEHEPAITFDMDDPRWDEAVERRWSAREQANPYSGAILRFLESPLIESILADPEALSSVERMRVRATSRGG